MATNIQGGKEGYAGRSPGREEVQRSTKGIVTIKKGRHSDPFLNCSSLPADYRVDSISNPQASSNGSGMYLEFLLRRAHSRRRVERKY